MEAILLLALVAGFDANVFFMRYFFKRISDKLTFLSSGSSEIPSAPAQHNPQGTIDPASLFKKPLSLYDNPSPNQVGEDESAIELSEQNLSALPKDVKFEVEGGDAHLPPGFEEGDK